MRVHDDYSVHHTSHTVGPRHDPYQNDEWMVVNKATGRAAVWYRASLGDDKLKLFEAGEDTNPARSERFCFDSWNTTREQRAATKLKWEILFRRWVGVSLDDAESEFHRTYEPDPMGSPAMYV